MGGKGLWKWVGSFLLTLGSSYLRLALFCLQLKFHLPMVAKRPASYRDPKPRNPKILEKKTQRLPPGPRPQIPKKKLKKH